MAKVPYISRDDINSSEQNIYDKISSSRGSVQNVFSALLNNPPATEAVTNLGEYIRYKSTLNPATREIAILVTAKQLNNSYEWSQHEPVAKSVGVSDDIIQYILEKDDPNKIDTKESIFIEAAKELVTSSQLKQKTFDALMESLGMKSTMDFIVTVGYYTMLDKIISALDVDFDKWMTKNQKFN